MSRTKDGKLGHAMKHFAPKPKNIAPICCDMEHGCKETVTHIDNKGFVYCAKHGVERKAWRPCRKLRAFEVQRLLIGKTISYERKTKASYDEVGS